MPRALSAYAQGIAWSAALAVSITGLTGVAATPAPAAQGDYNGSELRIQSTRESAAESSLSSTLPPGYYQVKGSPEVYAIREWMDSYTQIRPLTLQEWLDAGAPKPTEVTPAYVKYAWSPVVYSVFFFGQDASQWVWDRVSFDEWAAAGYPKPGVANWIIGTTYFKYASDPWEIFAIFEGTQRKLGPNEWSPGGLPGSPSGEISGTTTELRPEEFMRMKWDSTVFMFPTTEARSRGENARRLTWSEWLAYGAPTPWAVSYFGEDMLTRACNSHDIYYYGPLYRGKLNFEQWRSSGYRVPVVTGIC